jgi:hypothetical protein
VIDGSETINPGDRRMYPSRAKQKIAARSKSGRESPDRLQVLDQEEEVEKMSAEVGAARWRRAKAARRWLRKAGQGCLEETPSPLSVVEANRIHPWNVSLRHLG